MSDMVFRTQGDVLEYLQSNGLKISKSKLNRDYLGGLLVRGDVNGFLEADVLAYAESLREPTRPTAAPIQEELDALKRLLRRLFRAIPDAAKMEKTLAAWLDAAGKNADANTREAAQEAQERLRAQNAEPVPDDTRASDTPEVVASAPPDEFSALCLGIIADGIVNESEAEVLARWLKENPQADTYAMRQLQKRLDHIVQGGKLSSRDGKDLCKTLKGLIGGALPEWLKDKRLPERPRNYDGRPVRDALMLTPEIPGLYDEVDKIDMQAAFCFTGVFAFGDRPDCEAQAAQKGGTVIPRPLKGARCYLVVGSVASPDWAHGCYGRKVELAMRYRAEGAPLKIIPEDVWASALTN